MKTETSSRKIKTHRHLTTSRYDAYVDAEGTVRIWDNVAGHYTTCHSLTAAQLRYIRARAK